MQTVKKHKGLDYNKGVSKIKNLLTFVEKFGKIIQYCICLKMVIGKSFVYGDKFTQFCRIKERV